MLSLQTKSELVISVVKLHWGRCQECGRRFWLRPEREPLLRPIVCEACEEYLLDVQAAYERSPEAVW